MKPELHTQIQTLRKYQAWRTGEDERTMDEAGIVPAAVTSALDAVLEIAEKYLRGDTTVVTCQLYGHPLKTCAECNHELACSAKPVSVPDSPVKAAYVQSFGSADGWEREPGSWFTEGYLAARRGGVAVSVPSDDAILEIAVAQSIAHHDGAAIVWLWRDDVDIREYVLDFAHALLAKYGQNTACCNNPSQCWEPCGELGKSMEHARVAETAKDHQKSDAWNTQPSATDRKEIMKPALERADLAFIYDELRQSGKDRAAELVRAAMLAECGHQGYAAADMASAAADGFRKGEMSAGEDAARYRFIRDVGTGL